ncbi:hypothetical protein TNCV_30491 [Trichonephila clavipes]|nr:hypothetical protein TNCV_30491 [Trichonephila clavipes]
MWTAVSWGLGSIPREDTDVYKCMVPLRHVGTLNSRRALSPLVRFDFRKIFFAADLYSMRVICLPKFKPVDLILAPKRRGSLLHDAAVVTDSWPACHEFEPSTTEDLPYREARHVKSVEAQASSRWCGAEVSRGGSSSGVVLVISLWLKISRSVAKALE